MLNYHMPLYRPPSEGKNSLIFQVTLGCSFNQCSFCSMYRSKTFEIRPWDDLKSEIDLMAKQYPWVDRIFLADGDALVCPTDYLVQVLDYLYEVFPNLDRVTTYALPNNLKRKTLAELEQIHRHGLSMIYYGIESGSADILRRITKGGTPDSMIEGLNKAKDAGLKISGTVILGLGGTERWKDHIDGTADLINRTQLDYVSTLQLVIDPRLATEFKGKWCKSGGNFYQQDDQGLLQEQIRLVEKIEPSIPVTFRSNHASNALPLAGELPQDRAELLSILKGATEGDIPLRTIDYRRL